MNILVGLFLVIMALHAWSPFPRVELGSILTFLAGLYVLLLLRGEKKEAEAEEEEEDDGEDGGPTTADILGAIDKAREDIAKIKRGEGCEAARLAERAALQGIVEAASAYKEAVVGKGDFTGDAGEALEEAIETGRYYLDVEDGGEEIAEASLGFMAKSAALLNEIEVKRSGANAETLRVLRGQLAMAETRCTAQEDLLQRYGKLYPHHPEVCPACYALPPSLEWREPGGTTCRRCGWVLVAPKRSSESLASPDPSEETEET